MADGNEDISLLPNLSEDTILNLIKNRFNSQQIYSRIGSSTLLAVNPFSQIKNNDEASKEFANFFKQDFEPDFKGRTRLVFLIPFSEMFLSGNSR